MQKRKIGDNLEVSAIRLGCMGLSVGDGPTRRREAGDDPAQIALALRLAENLGAVNVEPIESDRRAIAICLQKIARER